MLARELLELRDLLLVAGQAGCGLLLVEGDRLGGVRVPVAGEAIGKLIVLAALVTIAAEGDVGLGGRPVPGVAVLAADLALVLAAALLDVTRLLLVTLDAVLALEGDLG